MPNSNILRGRGGGGGGAGFTLGPATNTFGVITTTMAAAVTLRDDYATANADWLAQYDANGALMVRLLHTGTPGATYYVRAASAWVTVTAAIEGPRGPGGIDGTAGGGAWDLLGTFSQTVSTVQDDIWLDLGFAWPTDTDWMIVSRLGGNASVPMYIPDITGRTAGLVGGTPVAAQRRLVNDAGLAGTVYLGVTAAGGALIEFSQNHTTAVTIRFFEYVPSDVQAMGGGTSEARVQQLINATSLSALQGMVTDAQIPDAIFRDAELTAAAVQTLLGLTATEVNDIFTGASITGQVVTFTQNDGTTATITIPAGTGGMADGVVASGAFNATGTELTLTLDTGGTVVIDVPALLRGAGAADGSFLFGTGVPATTLGIDGDAYLDTDAGTIYKKASSAWSLEFTAQEAQTGSGVRIAVGWSADQVATAAELTATSETDTVTVPTNTGNQYLLVWDADVYGDLNGIYYGQSPNNSISAYEDPVALELDGVAGMVRVSSSILVGSVIGGRDLRVTHE